VRALATVGDVHLKRIIPCLDVNDGRVVKGVEFVDIRDAGDPVELAAHYDREGADELVFLDITATHEKRDTIVALARRTADEVFVPFTIGGGIRSVEDAQAVLDAGADKVSINSAALERPQLIDELARVFGTQCVVLAVDAKARSTSVDAKARPAPVDAVTPASAAEAAVTTSTSKHHATPSAQRSGAAPSPSWEAYVAGGRTATGRDVVAWVREAVERGAGEILLTSMDRDGTSDGYDLALTRAVGEAVAVPVIASGGAGELEHLAQALHAGADAALCASIFHYGQHTVGEAKAYLNKAGIPVRTG
jgi:imidazole glycerol-phosphate synthase subunit HisF